MSETARISDQLHRAFHGRAWHGDSLFKILNGVTPAQAAAHPVANAHSIWELVLHIAAWDGVVHRRLAGETVTVTSKQNFPPVKVTSKITWRQTLEHVGQVHDELVDAVVVFPDSRLGDRVPGKGHNIYHMLHGAVQHELYHAGQIALLKKIV